MFSTECCVFQLSILLLSAYGSTQWELAQLNSTIICYNKFAQVSDLWSLERPLTHICNYLSKKQYTGVISSTIQQPEAMFNRTHIRDAFR